jgi:Holliday junction DNA helicase RuvB
MPPRTIELDASLPESDPTLDRALRPTSLEEYVGQAGVVGSLRAMLAGATGRGEPVEHLLFYGPPGLGKTSLAGIIAGSAGTKLRAASGPSLERAGDLVAILTNLERGDVLFLDEIHRLGAAVQEILYGAMEDFRIDIVVGSGPEASTLSLPVAPFTLIGATTDVDRVAGPLRDRFGAIFRLDWYSNEEIASILVRSAGKLDLPIDDAAVDYLAARSRGVPRIANRLLRRLRDEVALEGATVATVAIAERAMGRLGIDERGLDDSDRRVLATLAERYGGGPVGLAPLAAITGDPVSTIEGVIEPYLVRIGFLDRTPRGRVLTEAGRAHLTR